MSTPSSANIDAQQMLDVMAQMQADHNAHVHPEWRTQGYEYYRAIWVECAEMLDHYGWKWWKQQDCDIDQVKLELVDIWHFALSEMLRADTLDAEVANKLVAVMPAADPQAFRLAIEALALSTLTTRSFEIEPFMAAMSHLPLGYAELFRLYVGKNVLNNFRQDHGYKTGTYKKLWSGREDNEHLIDAINALDVAPLEMVAALRAALEERYAAA
ncbi:MAG: dUTP diphosphatase [Pseudomonadota bacterium]